MSANPFESLGQRQYPMRNFPDLRTHQKFVARWERVVENLDGLEDPDLGSVGWGVDAEEAREELTSELRGIEEQLFKLRAKMRQKSVPLPPPSTVPPMLLKRMRQMGEAAIFPFDQPGPKKKDRFRAQPAEEPSEGPFPVTVSWVTAASGWGIPSPGSVTVDGEESTYPISGAGGTYVNHTGPDLDGIYHLYINGEPEIASWSPSFGWEVFDSEYMAVTFS